MEPREFRKLNIDLPRQPLSEQQSWLVAGILLAFAILVITAYSYIVFKKQASSLKNQEENSVRNR
jgi:hypothetical protein